MDFLIALNQFLWSGPILLLLIGLHLYHTIHLRFIQRKIYPAICLSLLDEHGESSSGFSRFGSLTTTLAATLGTGNIVGVSTAVFFGGPGAVFWCWVTGLLGMATTYAESYLCSRYRFTDKDGNCRSGPMYLLRHLLHRPVMAFLYSAALCLSALFIGCATQSNSLTGACSETFGFPPAATAILTAFLVGIILLQGESWIEKFSMAAVPSMALFFFGSCLLYLVLHAEFIMPALGEIIRSAFSPSSIGGGALGYTAAKAMRYGIARGLFTNEAGLGTAGLVAGNSIEKDAGNQALVSMSASFWDTVVLCAVTGIVIVAYELEYAAERQSLSAGSLVSGAFSKLPFYGDEILTIAIFCFAVATLVGWSYIGFQGFSYMTRGRAFWLYHAVYIIMIFIGGILPLSLAWELTDFINLFLLIPSVYLLIRCRIFFDKT